jgi:hypothetical protein
MRTFSKNALFGHVYYMYSLPVQANCGNRKAGLDCEKASKKGKKAGGVLHLWDILNRLCYLRRFLGVDMAPLAAYLHHILRGRSDKFMPIDGGAEDRQGVSLADPAPNSNSSMRRTEIIQRNPSAKNRADLVPALGQSCDCPDFHSTLVP